MSGSAHFLRLWLPDYSEFDGRSYLFEPEYTDEELLALENESAEREVQRAEQAVAASQPGTSVTWWCSCGCCVQMDTEEESLCCKEWDIIQPNVSQDVSARSTDRLVWTTGGQGCKQTSM